MSDQRCQYCVGCRVCCSKRVKRHHKSQLLINESCLDRVKKFRLFVPIPACTNGCPLSVGKFQQDKEKFLNCHWKAISLILAKKNCWNQFITSFFLRLPLHSEIWEPLVNGDKRSPTYYHQTTIYSDCVRFSAKECSGQNPFPFSCTGNYNILSHPPPFATSHRLVPAISIRINQMTNKTTTVKGS